MRTYKTTDNIGDREINGNENAEIYYSLQRQKKKNRERHHVQRIWRDLQKLQNPKNPTHHDHPRDL